MIIGRVSRITAIQLRWRELESKGVKFWYISLIMYKINIIMAGQLHFVYWIWQATLPIRQKADKRADAACAYITKGQSLIVQFFPHFLANIGQNSVR